MMDLEIGATDPEFRVEIVELDLIFQPSHMLDLDQSLDFDIDNTTEGVSCHSVINGWMAYLSAEKKSSLEFTEVKVRYDLHDDTPYNHYQMHPFTSQTALPPPGPRFRSPKSHAYLLNRYENGEIYDSELIVPMPMTVDGKQPNGVVIVTRKDSEEPLAIFMSTYESPVVPQFVRFPGLNTVRIILSSQLRNAAKFLCNIKDKALHDLAPNLDALVVPHIFVMEGKVYVWSSHAGMLEFYTEKKVEEPVALCRNMLKFKINQTNSVMEALNRVKKPSNVVKDFIVPGNHIGTLMVEFLIKPHENPQNTIHNLIQYIEAVRQATLTNSLSEVMREMERKKLQREHDILEAQRARDLERMQQEILPMPLITRDRTQTYDHPQNAQIWTGTGLPPQSVSYDANTIASSQHKHTVT